MRSDATKRWLVSGAVVAGATVVALAAAGGLDATFGTGGVAQTDLAGVRGYAFDNAVQDDGRVLVVGYDQYGATLSEEQWHVRRYTSGGALDTAYGSGGSVTLFAGTGINRLYDVALDGDDQAVLAGRAAVAVTSKGKTKYEVRAAVARLTTSGALDGSFGSGGTVTLAVPGAAATEARAVAVQADGKLVVAGTATFTSKVRGTGTISDPAVFVARFTAAGALDSSFGSSGVRVNDLSSGTAFEWVYRGSIALQSDGGIVVGCEQANGGFWTLVRFTTSGAIDTAFGEVNGADRLRKIAVDGSDRIVCFGMRGLNETARMVVARYTASGAFDTTFGASGVRVIDTGELGSATCGAVQADGKVLVAGHVGSTSAYDAVVVRLNADGSDDTTYGTGGVGARVDLTNEDHCEGLALDPSGRAVIAGYTWPPSWYAARYETN